MLWAVLGAFVGVVVSSLWFGDKPEPVESQQRLETTAAPTHETVPARENPKPLAARGFADAAPMELRPSREELLREAELQASKHERQWQFDAVTDVEQSLQVEEQFNLVATSPRLLAEVRSQPVRFDAKCRSTMCRIESGFAKDADPDGWVSRVLVDMGSTFGATTSIALPQANGEISVVTYAYRTGRAPRS